MCGRFTLTIDPSQLEDIFPWAIIAPDILPRYNISPSQPIAAIPNSPNHQMEFFRWGLIPSWAKDASIGNRMINARAETLAEKPSFKNALKKRRCLIPSDGFYEWKVSPDGKSKIPHYIRFTTGQAFAFAGLWDLWTAPDGSLVKSCTIITTLPNLLISPIHNRMPVILPRESYLQWVEPGEVNPLIVKELFAPLPPDQMEVYAVSRDVNDPKNDNPSLVLRM